MHRQAAMHSLILYVFQAFNIKVLETSFIAMLKLATTDQSSKGINIQALWQMANGNILPVREILGVVAFLSHASTHTLPLMVPLATCCMRNTTTPIWISLDFFLCRIALWQISYFVNIERILPLKKFPCDIIITFLYWNDLPLRCNCANEPFLKLLPDSLTWLCFFWPRS